MDPIQFIRDRLPGPAVDVKEFHDLKQKVTQLNEEVSQMKGELTQYKSILSKYEHQQQQPSPDVPIDVTKISHDDSNQSMENNIGDSNHVSLLHEDETLLFDNTADQTAIDAMSTEKPQNKLIGEDFTMEIIEVDVVAQTSMDLLPSIEIEKSGDSTQNDETISVSMINASEMTMHEENDDSIRADIDDPQDNVPYKDGAGQNSSIELNAEMVIEDTQINCIGRVASTPIKLNPANIEDLPIVMKTDDSADHVWVIWFDLI